MDPLTRDASVRGSTGGGDPRYTGVDPCDPPGAIEGFPRSVPLCLFVGQSRRTTSRGLVIPFTLEE